MPVFASSSTFTELVKLAAWAPPLMATTSKLKALPAILVLITPVIAPAAVAVSKALKLETATEDTASVADALRLVPPKGATAVAVLVKLPSVDCALLLSDCYEKVDFETAENS